MSRKQCKRKIYALVNPIAHAIDGIKATPEDTLDKLRLRELSALESFRTGQASMQDWNDLASMMNLCENMARNKIGAEAMPSCEKASDALKQSAKRYKDTGRMGITGEGLQSLREVFYYHDLQRASISLSEYERQIQETANRIKGRAPEVVEV